jgi:hypothetical protein
MARLRSTTSSISAPSGRLKTTQEFGAVDLLVNVALGRELADGASFRIKLRTDA